MNTNATGGLPSTDDLPSQTAEGPTEEAYLIEWTSATSGEDASPNPRTLDPPATPKRLAQNALVLGGC